MYKHWENPSESFFILNKMQNMTQLKCSTLQKTNNNITYENTSCVHDKTHTKEIRK